MERIGFAEHQQQQTHPKRLFLLPARLPMLFVFDAWALSASPLEEAADEAATEAAAAPEDRATGGVSPRTPRMSLEDDLRERENFLIGISGGG